MVNYSMTKLGSFIFLCLQVNRIKNNKSTISNDKKEQYFWECTVSKASVGIEKIGQRVPPQTRNYRI